MTSLWEQHAMSDRVRTALEAVHLANPDGHHFGRPFVSSYQLAISMDAADPGLAGALDKDVGGAGTGAHHSLAQYIGNELSKQIRSAELRGEDHFVEGVFMSNQRVQTLTYRGNGGAEVTSSLVGTEYDMALFRLR